MERQFREALKRARVYFREIGGSLITEECEKEALVYLLEKYGERFRLQQVRENRNCGLVKICWMRFLGTSRGKIFFYGHSQRKFYSQKILTRPKSPKVAEEKDIGLLKKEVLGFLENLTKFGHLTRNQKG